MLKLICGCALVTLAGWSVPSAWGAVAAPSADPIAHVVVIYQENHSFDNVLGRWCVEQGRCNGATAATLSTGATYTLGQAADKVPDVRHTDAAQVKAMNHGKMNQFDRIRGCGPDKSYACLTQFEPSQIPNLISLASAFSVSDATFESEAEPSWGSHLELVTGNLDGFTGDNPKPSGDGIGSGWGCDSYDTAPWRAGASAAIQQVPSCIPDPNLDPAAYPFGGAFEPTPVPWEPTVMDQLTQAGLSWKIDSTFKAQNGVPYGWAICPTFADCLDTSQSHDTASSRQIITDATDGSLPNVSIVTPSGPNSQHNGWSMAVGDNWIGQVMDAIMHGPEWDSTAVIIAYDDCGCFYDHVAPPKGLGIRVPVLIVSPWVKPGSTDSTTAKLSSILAFIENTFGLPCMGPDDCGAYDYSNSFALPASAAAAARPPDRATPLMVTSRVPRQELRLLRLHPPSPQDS